MFRLEGIESADLKTLDQLYIQLWLYQFKAGQES
jgi:hypothetical protein